MQFAVPQFTDVEDRIIGPLTIKQFFVLLLAGGIILFFWSLKLPGIIFFPLALIIAIIGVALTFGKYNGRQLFSYAFPFVSFMMSPKVMIYKREPVEVIVAGKPVAIDNKVTREAKETEAPESRLKKLAYLLDEKSAKESELIDRK